jgi:RND family efflux transporter MFP subunit
LPTFTPALKTSIGKPDPYCSDKFFRILVITLGALFIQACSEPKSTDIPTATIQIVEVEVHELQPQIWQGSINTFGVIEAPEEVNVAAELSGTVMTVLVNEGDRVEAGQLLLELDPLKRELAQQHAKQQAQKALSTLKEARLKLERRRDLAQRDTISEEAFDSAQLSVDSASAAYQQALANAQLAARGLRDTKILSPTSGLVDIQAVEVGEPVAAGVSLITLQAMGSLRMHTWVSEADITNVRAGANARVTASGISGRQYQAHIEWVGVNADPQTGNFPVKLILEDNTEAMRPGMTASAQLDRIGIPNSLWLPESALVDRDRRRVVFIEEDGVARLREPILAAGFNNRLQILGGLTAGDKVITGGQKLLKDGTAVKSRASGSLQ